MSARDGRHRIRIERLDLDMRGIPATTADAAARALGPALARALASVRGPITPADRIDAGRITSTAATGAHELATRIAERVAHAVRREDA